ncbi:MAG: hypothetical protein NVS2B6_15480 [Thermoleophilaceae bacterium]
MAVTTRGSGQVRVSASALGRPIGPGRSLSFRTRGTQVVDVPLNEHGRTVARSCGRLTVVATASNRSAGAPRSRARRRRSRGRRRGSRRRPLFTAGAASASSSRQLEPDPSGCYRIGIAERSINPQPDGNFGGQPVYLGGYGFGGPPATSGRRAAGILADGVHVRAFAVSDGTSNFVVADMETQGTFAADKDGPLGIVDMRREIERETGGAVRAEQVLIQSDHTHGGPDTLGVWGGVPLAYRQFIKSQTVAAVIDAVHGERPGTLYYGTADGADLLANQFSYDPQNRVLDSDVRLLQGRDPDGRAFATMLNFSAHATVLGGDNHLVTGDWPQQANKLMAQRFGGDAMTVVGTLGRTQPADRTCPNKSLPAGPGRDSCTLDDYATRVVDRAGRAAASAQPIDGAPVVDARSYLIQDVGSSALILGLDYAGDPLGVPIYRSLSPPWLTGTVLGTVTSSARIGDVLVSSMPGEAYPQIALRVGSTAQARGFITAGLGDDQLGYLIAPYEAYPEPIRRSFFNQRGDQVSPLDNDNYFFNVSHTIGERVTCSLLRGAGEVFGRGMSYSAADDRCAAFVNDQGTAHGADVR